MKTVTSKETAKVSAVPTKIEAAKLTEAAVRIVKTAQCPSLSGKSDLTYEVGLTDDKELRLRLTANSGKGAFCQDWIDMNAVRAALDKTGKGESIMSDVLIPLFRSRSANMPGFVFSVLMREGFVRPSEKSKRRYERAEPTTVDAIVKSLADGKGATTTVEKKSGKLSAGKPAAAKPKKDKPSKKGT